MPAAVPSIKDFFFPILKVLASADGPLERAEYARRAADLLKLTDEQRAIRIPSGKHLTYRHRAGWATNELKHAGFVTRPAHGLWTATEAGRAYLADHPTRFGNAEIAEIRRLARQSGPDPGDENAGPEQHAGVDDASESPEEQIERAVAALRESIATELLQRLLAADPGFFENVVLDVLHGLGYGVSRASLKQVGGSGDAGIDGIIHLDRLGLQKVYVQAKRWQNKVGRPEIQAFYGALSGRRANQGVFITTSKYTREAREYAASVSDALVLVSGRELARLMIDCGVGVRRRAVQVPEVDDDYFDE